MHELLNLFGCIIATLAVVALLSIATEYLVEKGFKVFGEWYDKYHK